MARLPQPRIDRGSPLPFYFQLAEALEGEIRNGRLKSGARLPSEPALCERYGISRTTVRQALARLEQRGLIARRKGQGTFVESGPPGLWLLQSSEGFFQAEVDRAVRKYPLDLRLTEQLMTEAGLSKDGMGFYGQEGKT